MPLAGDDIPVLVEGVDARVLALSPIERFVLSRIDGTSTASEIAGAIGVDDKTALAALERLLALGALRPKHVAWGPRRPPSGTAFESPSKTGAQPPGKRHSVPPPTSLLRVHDPVELAEDVEMGDARKRRVLDVFYRLGTQNHYEVLEVGRDATKEEIREAYFALSKEFHPDTAFGKELGSYKSKMEKIFTAATGAYDVLSRRARKTEYDATLRPPGPDDADWRARRLARPAATTSKLSVRPLVPESVRPPPNAKQLESPVETDVAAPATTPAAAAPPSASNTSPLLTPTSDVAEPVRRPNPTPSPEQLKRQQELLKMRLAGGRPRITPVSSPDVFGSNTPGPIKPADPGVVRADVLRGLAASLRDASHVTGSGQTVRRHLAAAVDAEAQGDLKGALAAVRLAQALVPDDPRITEQVARLETARSAEEAPVFEERAMAEEKAGKWEAAGLAWLRVVEGRPNDARVAARCANALLEGKLDLKTARMLAQRAVDADPGKVTSRTLLARVYIAAGMRASAKRELDTATKLDPANEIVKNLLRELG